MATTDFVYRAEERFRALKETIPDEGEILTPVGGHPVKVYTDETAGRKNVYVFATIDAKVTGWFLADGPPGLKCVIAPEFHASVGDRVEKLLVLRRSVSGKALICAPVEE
jgi:hypothetical protein